MSSLFNKLNPRNSIKARLIWSTVSLVSVLSLSLSFLVGYVGGIRIETTRKQYLEQLAYQMADKLERGMFERYKDIQILSTLNVIQQPGDSFVATKNLLEKLQNLYPDYAWIGLTDTRGNIVASTGGLLEGENASARRWFQEARTKPYVEDVREALLLAKLPLNPDDEPLRFVDVAAPVVNDRNEFQGVICAYLSWSWMRDVKRSLTETMGQQSLAEVFILNKNGYVLVEPPGFEKEKITIPSIEPIDRDRASYFIDTRSDRQQYLTGFAYSEGYQSYPGLGWIVLVRQKKDLAFATVRSLQKQVLGAGLMMGVLFAFLSWLSAKRISEPIITLANIADRIRRGETDVKILAFKGRDELAILSQSLIYAIATLDEQKQALIAELHQRRQAETKLQKQALIFNSIQDGIVLSDLEGQIIDWNLGAEKMFGYSKAEVLGQTPSILYKLEDLAVLTSRVFKSLLDAGFWSGAIDFVRQDGTAGVCDTIIVPQLDERGNLLYTISIHRDVTARKRAEESLRASEARYRALSASLEIKVKERTEKLRRQKIRLEAEIIDRQQAEEAAEAANRAKSEFLANMSHELRTPLNAILGFSQLMSRDSSLARSHQENLDIINRSGQHLLELINDILDMSKIEAGKLTLRKTDFNLHHLLDDLEAMFALKARYKDLQLNFQREDNLPTYIKADEKKLRQVLINILGNAIKFTKVGSVILRALSDRDPSLLETSSKAERSITIHFEIEDTGIGIAPEEIDSLFDPFSQLRAGYKSQEGTGLGLSISDRFVKLMGGNITVTSLLNRGTTFKLEVPVQLASNGRSITVPQPRVIALAPNQPRYRILIVEDESANRQLLSILLKSVGFAVREATNGREAIALWSSWSPHLIWMDLRMPVMQGDEATRQIRATTKGQETVIIALTASVFESEKGAILAAGCNDLVSKPFQEEVIFNKMSRYLGVKYIFAANSPILLHSDTTQSAPLTPEALAMPDSWIEKLHRAAIRLDEKAIEQLIEQIPEQNTDLKVALTYLVAQIRFDTIVKISHREVRQ